MKNILASVKQNLNRFGLMICISAIATSSLSVASSALPLTIQGKNLLTGKEEKLEFNKAKKGTVLVFISSRCPCSINHEPRLIELAKEFSPAGFQFVGIHSNKSVPLERAKDHFQKEAKLGFSVLDDSKLHLANLFEASYTPHAFVVGPDGKVLFKGGVDSSHNTSEAKEHFLKDALKAISAGETDYTKDIFVLGCSIDR